MGMFGSQDWVDAVRRTMDKFSLCPTAQTQATFLGVVRGAYGLTEGVAPMVLDRFIGSTLNCGPTGNGDNEIILVEQNILRMCAVSISETCRNVRSICTVWAFLLLGAASAPAQLSPPLPLIFQSTPIDVFPNATFSSGFARLAFLTDDVDGDGRGDVAVRTFGPGAQNGPTNDGQILVISSATGGVVYTINGPILPGQSLAAIDAASIGDCDGDGVDDIATIDVPFGIPPNPNGVHVFSGATGMFLYTAAPIGIGSAAAEIERLSDDIDGDGIEDFCVGYGFATTTPLFGNPGTVVVHSGATGGVIVQTWGTASESLGAEIACPGDLDGDGFADVIARSFAASGQPNGASNLYAFRITPTSMSLLYTFSANGVSGNFFMIGVSPCRVGDIDRDGCDDFMFSGVSLTSSSPPFTGPAASPIEVRSGATGQLIRTLVPPSGQLRPRFGESTAFAGDVDGDGFGDVLVGSVVEDYGPFFPQVGVAFVYSGATGDVLYAVHGDSSLPLSGAFPGIVDGGRDMDGDGLSDILCAVANILGSSSASGFVRVYGGRPAFHADAARGDVVAFGGAGTADVLGVSVAGAATPIQNNIGRTFVVNSGSPLNIWMARPPGHLGSTAQHIIFGRVGGSVLPNATTLPGGLGDFVFAPSLIAPSDPSLFVLSSTYPATAILPAIPAYAALPGTPVAQIPPIGFPVTFGIQALVEDTASVGPAPISITNALRIIVR